MKNLFVLAAAAVSLFVAVRRAPAPQQDGELAALETRLNELESHVASRDHLLMLSAAWLLDRMELTFDERSSSKEEDVAALRTHVTEVLREGSQLASGMLSLIEDDRLQLALHSPRAAADLRDDIGHRIRIFEEEKVDDGPGGDERRRRRQAWIQRYQDYLKRTPDPELVERVLNAAQKK